MAGPDADAGHDMAQVAWPMTYYLNNHARPLWSVAWRLASAGAGTWSPSRLQQPRCYSNGN
jgi:hypothetical protein